ncbi:MAG: type II toxin-antitoxin system RelE/ParE family toxin [Gammaproteobacteria bacterium]|nr:type II toxin-antitoxin system RelE/ParE family toxin [Gammaproteobacteria bacterium]
MAQDSPIRAKQVVDRLTRRSERLVFDPRADRRVPEYQQDDLREVLERPFRLIYVVRPDRVEIVTVKHYRQRLPKQPADL